MVEVGEDEVAPLHAPKSVRTAKRILPWWRRPLTLVAEAAMLLIAVGVTTWFLLQSPPTLAFAARDWVVVGNLHNLTDDKLYDQSVDSALRISLEQSQYVNVLPELSVQQTLQRMALNPDKTDVNRAIGSQVALREGARAMILPTVADVGGRVRVTAEVIDPNTQATVYSVSADGVGAQSVLPSLDSVSKQLRGKLGEALAMVSKQSQPLAQVATPDLNALKAYSLGEQAYDEGDLKSAETYFNEALRIDPHFALTRIALAKIYEAENQPDDALLSIRQAKADHVRLSARDALYVEAWDASYTAPQQALKKWKLLVSVYPDDLPALGAYAYFLREYANRFEDAIPYLLQSITPKNPQRAASETMLGALYIQAGRYKDAQRAFSEATADGMRSQSTVYTLLYAAQRNFSEATAIMAGAKSSGLASQSITDAAAVIAVAVDQGNWRHANELLKAAQAKPASLPSRVLGGYRAISLSLRALDGTPIKAQLTKLTDYISSEAAMLAHADSADRLELKFQIVLAAYLAAHSGDTKLAERAIAALGNESEADTPVLDNLQGVAKAEIERALGRPHDALLTLKPLVNGSELYITHIALLDAYTDARDTANALAEARWLSSHRGRAYAESDMRLLLAPFNVASSDLALLRSAELSRVSDDEAGALRFLTEFKHAWPSATQMPWLASRLKKASE